ncbi:hypothetical protein NKH49_31990 [Mesorhizobium sp. M1088]|uniref:hypothetical protein n=1 Tax=unclassified Mesorhizobium TaxID=325217 RepID=UPI0033352711
MGFASSAKDIASWPSQLRSIAAESALMLADALAGGRFTRHNDLLLPAGIIAGAGPQAGHMVHHTAPLSWSGHGGQGR